MIRTRKSRLVVGAVALVGMMAGTASAGKHRRYRDVVYVPATPVVVGAAPVAVAPTVYAVPTAYVTPTVVTTRTVVAAPVPTTYVVPARRVQVLRPRVVVADPLVVPATAVYAPVYGLYP
jgi:hypothetical protein